MLKSFYLLLLICPVWLYSQTSEYLSHDTLDEFIIEGIQYENYHYFISGKGEYNDFYDDYVFQIMKFDSALTMIGSKTIDSIDSYQNFPWNIIIENDTIYLFGAARSTSLDDFQIYYARLTLDLSLIDSYLIGSISRDEMISSAILMEDGTFVTAGRNHRGFQKIDLLINNITKDGQVLVDIVDSTWSAIRPKVVYLAQSSQFHFVDQYIFSIYDSNLVYDTTVFNNLSIWFSGNVVNYNTESYFMCGDGSWIYSSDSELSSPSLDVDMDITYFLLNDEASAVDDGYIQLPNIDDHCGALDFSPSNTLVIGGVHNYRVDLPSGFEKENRWIVVQNLDYPAKTENWFFEYGGDANYLVKGLYITEPANEVIVYSDRYDWMNTDRLDRDIFIIKIDSTGLLVSSDGIVDPIGEEFLIYPNPGKEEFRVKTDRNSAILFLFDMYGRLIIEQNLLSFESIISTSELEKGVYVYKIVDYNSSIQSSGIWIKQ